MPPVQKKLVQMTKDKRHLDKSDVQTILQLTYAYLDFTKKATVIQIIIYNSEAKFYLHF